MRVFGLRTYRMRGFSSTPLAIAFFAALVAACGATQDFASPGGSPPPSPPAAGEAHDDLPTTCAASRDDAQNCGACGHRCLGGACAAGVCQPLQLTTTSTSLAV